MLNQHKQSCFKLTTNGKASSAKGTRYFHIRYFFFTDRVKNKEIEIHYCPAEEMLGDFYTKSLQGSLYKKFGNSILGVSEENCFQYEVEYKRAKAKGKITGDR